MSARYCTNRGVSGEHASVDRLIDWTISAIRSRLRCLDIIVLPSLYPILHNCTAFLATGAYSTGRRKPSTMLLICDGVTAEVSFL